jgi:hypothetical protein
MGKCIIFREKLREKFYRPKREFLLAKMLYINTKKHFLIYFISSAILIGKLFIKIIRANCQN